MSRVDEQTIQRIVGVQADARFTAWLRQQHQRNDSIGDLARDMRRDHTWPRSANTLRTFLRHLKRMGACDGAEQALQRAFTEWQSAAWLAANEAMPA